MKAVVLGDPHFGGSYSLGTIDPYRQINSRLIDYSNTCDYVIDYMVDHGISHLIITGDVFEHRRPQASELALFAEKMHRTSELKIHTHIVVGNHDLTMSQNATTLDVLHELKLPYVHVYSNIRSVVCSDEGEDKINFVFFPFCTRKMLKCKTNEEAIERLSERLDYEVRGMGEGAKILVGHLMLEGTNITAGVLESPIAELVLPLDMFSDLDATVMGHVHPHQIIRKNPLIGYVGSMEKKKFDEGRHKKYFMVIDQQNGDLVFNFQVLPTRSLFDITIDQSDADTGEEVESGVKLFMNEYSEANDIVGGILRIQVFINEKALYGFEKSNVVAHMKKELGIQHCVGISTTVTSKRQLRKDSITERVDPQTAFEEVLELEEDSEIMQRVRELGTQIIAERGK